MFSKFTEPFWVFIFLALGGGAVAGAGMAGYHVLRGRQAHAVLLLAYVVVGAVAGLVHYFLAPLVGIGYESPEAVFRGALMTGVITLLIITGRDIGFKMTINRFGWRGKVELFRPSNEKEGGGK